MTESLHPAEADPLDFTPVPSASTRHDGWTPERQRRFVEALTVMGVVSRAARAVGKSVQSAHLLRKRAGAASFAEAWDIALQMGRDRAYEVAVDRALNGVIVPVFYRGRVVGSRHRFDYRLALAALDGPRSRPQPAQRSANNLLIGNLVNFARTYGGMNR